MLTIAAIAWSLTSLVTGQVNSFMVLVVMRFTLGVVESACNAPSYSLIADYFPPERRSTANAIESAGVYAGGALASLSIILIKQSGWRFMYKFVGLTGIILGAICFFLVKEPPRGRYDVMKAKEPELKVVNKDEEKFSFKDLLKDYKNAIFLIMQNPVSRYTTLGGCFRFIEVFATQYYMPSFIMMSFPQFTSEFGLIMALISGLCGTMSTIMGG